MRYESFSLWKLLSYFIIHTSYLLLRNPNQFDIVSARFVDGEIPIRGVLETRDVRVQKNKLRPLRMEIGVNERPAADCRQIFGIKHPYHRDGAADG